MAGSREGGETGQGCGIWRPRRRELLRVGAISAAGLSLADLFRPELAAARRVDVNCIFLFLWGGPGQHETFDPKPDAPAEIRGPFGAIPTTVDGLRFCEHLPLLAKQAREFTTVRNLHHDNSIHPQAAGWTLSGQSPLLGLRPPNHGAMVARFGARAGTALPSAVRIGPRLWDCVGFADGQDGGALGSAYAPFAIDDPRALPERATPLRLPAEVPPVRLDRRRALLGRLDELQRRMESDAGQGRDTAYERAFALLTSPAAKQALDLEQESPKTRERYGDTLPGQGLLLARRLVEAGVRFVQVNWCRYVVEQGWDTHGTGLNMGGTIPEMTDYLLPTLDRSVSALFEDLRQRGLHQNTLVVVAGEFGRTPELNKSGGRNHWPAVYSALLYGAGVPAGHVVGRSDAQGGYPDGDHCTPDDLAVTLYRTLGLDPAALHFGRTGEPAVGIPGIG